MAMVNKFAGGGIDVYIGVRLVFGVRRIHAHYRNRMMQIIFDDRHLTEY
jgi:hypothetical protein